MAAGSTIFSKRTSKPPGWLLKLTTKGCFKVKQDELSVGKIEPVSTVRYNKGKDNQYAYGNQADANGNHPNSPPSMSEVQEISYKTAEEMEVIYNQDWIKICRAIDKKLFMFFFVMIIVIQIFIALSLDKSAMSWLRPRKKTNYGIGS